MLCFNYIPQFKFLCTNHVQAILTVVNNTSVVLGVCVSPLHQAMMSQAENNEPLKGSILYISRKN